MDVSELPTVDAFWNGFWVFVGIVAGAIIQYFLGRLTQWDQRRNAGMIFKSEIAINRAELEMLKRNVQRKKERFSGNQITEFDFLFDLADFNYQIVGPLISAGWFHKMLGPEGVKHYFRFMNSLNIQAALRYHDLLAEAHQRNESLEWLDWFLNTKIPEWEKSLNYVEGRL